MKMADAEPQGKGSETRGCLHLSRHSGQERLTCLSSVLTDRHSRMHCHDKFVHKGASRFGVQGSSFSGLASGKGGMLNPVKDLVG